MENKYYIGAIIVLLIIIIAISSYTIYTSNEIILPSIVELSAALIFVIFISFIDKIDKDKNKKIIGLNEPLLEVNEQDQRLIDIIMNAPMPISKNKPEFSEKENLLRSALFKMKQQGKAFLEKILASDYENLSREEQILMNKLFLLSKMEDGKPGYINNLLS